MIKIEDPASRRRRRPLRAAVRRGRGLALLRGVQPQQEERLARPAPRRRAARCSTTSCGRATSSTRTCAATQPRKLGLTYEELAEASTRAIVCCSLSGFGMTGPAGGGGRLRLHDAGARRLAEPDRRPGRAADEERAVARRPLRRLRRRRSRCSPVSGARGATASAATATSRSSRRRCTSCCYVGAWAATRGYVPPRRRNSAHPSIVPFQNFATADGWIVVACPKEKFWALLCDALGRPELAADERFADFAGRDRNRDELLPILDAALRGADVGEWLELLARGRRPERAGQRRRRGARGSADARARRRRRGRAPDARHGAPGREPAPPRATSRAARAGAVPRRAHERGAPSRSAATRPSGVDELAAAGVFGEAA